MKAIVLVVIAALLAGCGGGPILANPPAQRPVATIAPRPSPLVVDDPVPVVFPRDDAPHDRMTEWWYYTGHLSDAEDDSEWGFEYVIFRAERGRFPVTWASHLAITNETGARFTYAQRSEIGPQVDRSSDSGFDFALGGGETPWEMRGDGGVHHLTARSDAPETTGDAGSISLDVELRSGAAPVLHDTDGWIDFGPAGGSYYYSRTRMPLVGTIEVDGREARGGGFAWFDHQWGDFIAVGGGGWDWFAVNLDDGTDLTLSLVRDRDGSYPLVYGTLVEVDGTVRHLPREAFSVEVTGRWLSPRTGVDYPAGWRLELPGEGLVIALTPTVAQQELDTRATTGVVYWEGSQVVKGTRGGQPLGGKAYVELTGYGAPEGP
jgi:predicted secreted hydrolase